MSERISFEVKLQKGCGIDIHKESISACFMAVGRKTEKKQYGTYTKDLLLLLQDIKQLEIEDAVIESTGIYWIPLYDLFCKNGIKVIVANPLRVKQIPGKKSDTSDCEWLCKLLLNGLVTASYIPEGELRQLRELNRQCHRYRKQRSQTTNRITKVLEACNFKLLSVLSRINTKTCKAIITAIANGNSDIAFLQSLCQARAKRQVPLLVDALQGTITDNDKILLQMFLKDWDHFDFQIKQLTTQIQQRISSQYEQPTQLLIKVPGIAENAATTIVAELGDKLDNFPTADHLTSWSGLAPGNRQSGGKWYNQHVTKGNKYLKTILIQVAWTAVRAKDTYWNAQFKWLRKRLSAKKAIVAIARKMLKLIYRILTQGYLYEEKGAKYFFEQRAKYLVPKS